MTPEEFSVQRLDELEGLCLAGEAEALLDAVAICINTGIKAPPWVEKGFNEAWLVRWKTAEARTLGEAFGIERPSNWRQGRAQKDELTFVIWQRVLRERRENGATIGRALFEEVAEALSVEHGVRLNGTDVQEAYYAVTKNRGDSR